MGSEKAAEDYYAQRTGLSSADFRARRKGHQVESEIRRSALDSRSLRDSNEGRQDGWS